MNSKREAEENPLVKKYGKSARWVSWRLVTRGGKSTKIPYQSNGVPASSTNPKTWCTYQEIKKKCEKIGIVLTDDKLLLAIDIDHVLKDGKLLPEFKDTVGKFINDANTYCEISPSTTGIHAFIEITEPLDLNGGNKKAPFELYVSGRYLTVTGRPFGKVRQIRRMTPDDIGPLLAVIGYPWQASKPSNLAQEATEPLGIGEDSLLLERMFSASNGAKVRALYDGDTSAYGSDRSRADFALLSHFAFWTGRNSEQMERLWLASPLGNREKVKEREDYRNRTISTAIAKCKEIYKPSKISAQKETEKKVRKTGAELLLERIDESEKTVLFRDQQGDAYVALEVSGHREIWPCGSKAVKRWLANEYWKLEKKAPPGEVLKNVVGVLEGRASFDGPQHRLDIRSAWFGDELWYDFTDETWRAVQITSEKWEIVDSPPILFKRYPHSRSQVTPTPGGDVRLLLKYINLKDEKQKLLLLVFLISCFVPDFAHVILVVFGSQGSAKSTLSKMLRRVIDPSAIEVASMPDSHKELVQTLAHHAFLFFDNVSYISESTSDILCKAVTGSGFPKRELFSDDEDIIYSFKRCVGINGINLVSTRPDLLERSLLLGLDRIDPRERKQEKELVDSFEKDLPLILGGIFDALVRALKIKPGIELIDTPRMADFAVWGCAIAEALGYTKDEFLVAYRANIDMQTEVSLNENVVAAAVISFMADKESWKGTATNLLQELTTHAAHDHFDVYEKYWPRASNSLMRRLNELAINLKAVGISFVSIPGNTREIVLKKDVTDDTDDTF